MIINLENTLTNFSLKKKNRSGAQGYRSYSFLCLHLEISSVFLFKKRICSKKTYTQSANFSVSSTWVGFTDFFTRNPLCLYIYIYVCVCVCVSVCLSVCLSVWCVSVYFLVCKSIILFINSYIIFLKAIIWLCSQKLFALVSFFYGSSIFMGYLMPKPFL